VLKQPQYQPMPVENQVAVIYAVTNGYLDELPLEKVRSWELGFHEALAGSHQDVLDGIREGKELTEEIEGKLVAAIEAFNDVFAAREGSAVPATA